MINELRKNTPIKLEREQIHPQQVFQKIKGGSSMQTF